MLWMMIPGTLGLAATQINILVNTVLATSQGDGAVSWLNYAFRLMQFPIGVFGVSFGAAALARISKLNVEKNWVEIDQSLRKSLLQVFAINLPAAAGLAALSVPIIEMLFEHGRFSHADTEATAWALAMYAIGLGSYSAVKVLVPACYALGQTRVAVTSSLVSVGFTLLFNVISVSYMGYRGLALGTSVAAVLNQVFLMVALRRYLGGQGIQSKGEAFFLPLAKMFLVSLLMGAAIFAAYWYGWREIGWEQLPQAAVLPLRVGGVGILVGLGAVLTLIFARLLGIGEMTEMVTGVIQRLQNRLRPATKKG